MQLEFSYREKEMTVSLSGELDHHSAGESRDKIDTAVLQHHCQRLMLDFSALTFMDSSGIGLIMGRYRLMQSIGGSLTVCGTSPRIERMIKLSGLESLPIWTSNERSYTT